MQYSVLDDELLFVSSKKQEFYSSERREMENSSFNRLTVSFLFFFYHAEGKMVFSDSLITPWYLIQKHLQNFPSVMVLCNFLLIIVLL